MFSPYRLSFKPLDVPKILLSDLIPILNIRKLAHPSGDMWRAFHSRMYMAHVSRPNTNISRMG